MKFKNKGEGEIGVIEDINQSLYYCQIGEWKFFNLIILNNVLKIIYIHYIIL